MNVSLIPELESFVQEKIASGVYNSASEVMSEALRLLREQDILQQKYLQELRSDIALGIEQAERGETGTFDVEDLKQRVQQAVSDMVVQDVESYQKLLDLIERLETIAGIKQGLEDVEAGRTISLSEFTLEMQQKYGISS